MYYPEFISFLWSTSVNSIYSNQTHDTYSKISSFDVGIIELMNALKRKKDNFCYENASKKLIVFDVKTSNCFHFLKCFIL